MAKKFSKPHLSRIINGDIIPPLPPSSPEKTRLDVALLETYPQYNRSTIQKYIKNGQVSVNQNVILKPNYPVDQSDHLDMRVRIPPSPPEIPIIYEDDQVIVLDKPAGLLTVSKGDFNPEPTLEPFGLIVHRLDRDTSGVIILAKNDQARSKLQKQFQNRKTKKTYYAIVVGHPKLEKAIIDVPLARNLKSPTTFLPDPEGRSAVTTYEVVDQNAKYSLLKLTPRTGRTHQLRVHLAHIGTPILGDKIYGRTPADRMYLHATELEITTPNGQRQTFTSKLPKEFDHALR
jgi:23S rRNA pseudouridine1911/1915/1917 synthase